MKVLTLLKTQIYILYFSPAKSVLAFRSKKVDMVFKLQFKNKVFLYGIFLVGFRDAIAE